MPVDKTLDPNKFKPVAVATADRAALRARFGAPPPLPREPVTLDYGDGSAPFDVEVRMLTGREKLALTDVALNAARAAAIAAGQDPSKIRFVQLAVQTPALLAATVCVPGTDERVFDGETDPMLAMMPPALLERLSDVAERLNREKPGAMDEAKNISGGTSTAATASPSPTS